MTLSIQEQQNTKVFEIQVTGKLTTGDYIRFVPQIEDHIRQFGRIRILFIMHDFHGWNAGALWQDLKFDLKHFSDIERLAMVGDKAWEKGMAVFCKPFTTAHVRYFTHEQIDQARAWLQEDPAD